jgi:hypothetical protein
LNCEDKLEQAAAGGAIPLRVIHEGSTEGLLEEKEQEIDSWKKKYAKEKEKNEELLKSDAVRDRRRREDEGQTERGKNVRGSTPKMTSDQSGSSDYGNRVL